jgi:hypothetical protein
MDPGCDGFARKSSISCGEAASPCFWAGAAQIAVANNTLAHKPPQHEILFMVIDNLSQEEWRNHTIPQITEF